MAFVAAQAVPTVVGVALTTGAALVAPIGVIVTASTAFVAMGSVPAFCVRTFGTATTAHTATIFIPVVVAATPAVHAVLVVGKDADDRGGNYAYEHYKRKKDSYDLFQNSVFHTSAPLSDGLTQAVRCGIMY